MKRQLFFANKQTGRATSGKSRIRQLLSAFILILATSAATFAQTGYVQLPSTAPTTSNNYRGPNGGADFQRTAMIYPTSETAGLPTTPQTINSLGFNIATPATTAATGTIKIYMANTTDATYTKGNVWTGIISGMTLVYDGPLTIPATSGFYDITLQTPFGFTGNGIYMAFEWTATTKSTGFPVYAANSSLANSLVSGGGATLQATLTAPGASAFRPQIRLGFTIPANDLMVKEVYSLGKLPLINAFLPHVVSAAIINKGTAAQNNVNVTMAVTGANTFNTTATIASIPVGDTVIVTFPGYTPTVAGNNTITVSVPADGINTNNTGTYAQITTTNSISYAVGDQPAHSLALRPVTPDGTLLAKFHADGTQNILIPSVKLLISFSPTSVGNTIYAVILDSTGTIIGRSADYVVQTADLSTLKEFPIISPPIVTNTDFYVGIAAVPGSANYFPLGVQSEEPLRPNTFYTGPIAGGSLPTPTTSQNRFVIEPVLQVAAANDVGISALLQPASGCGLSSNAQVCVIINNFGTSPVSNIPVTLNVSGAATQTFTIIYPGPIAPATADTVCAPGGLNLSTAGTYNFTLFTALAADANRSNDTTRSSVISFASPGSVTAANINRCGPGTATITPTATNTDLLVYFNSATGGNALSTGNSFQTPSVSTSTTFYVQGIKHSPNNTNPVPVGKVGPVSNTIGAGGYGNFTNHTTFDALVPMRIDSVKLISDGALTATIGVFDTLTGNRLDSVLVSLPGAGTHTVFLGLEVPAGNGYGLRVFSYNSGTGALFRNTAGAVFPYVFPGIVRITGNNFAVPANTSTRYYYFYDWSVSVLGCATPRIPVQVNITPLPTITVGSNQTVCVNGAAITLPAATPAGGTWSGNGVTSTGVFTPNASLVGNQTLTYSYTDPNTTCTNTAALTVTVVALPTVNAGVALSVCENNAAITLTGATPAGGTWSGNGVTSGGVFTPTTALIGAQTLTYTYTNTAGCTNTATRTVTVNATPATPSITQLTGDTLMASIAGSSYVWSLNGNVLAGVTGRKFKATANGTYTVTVTNASGCTSAASAGYAFTVTGLLGKLNRNLSLFPNPTTGSVQIQLENVNVPKVEMIVKTVTGQTVMSRTLTTQDHKIETTINLGDQAKGIYYLELRDGNNIANHKIVLQ